MNPNHGTRTLLILLVSVLAMATVNGVGTYPAVDPNMVLYYHFNNDSAYGENDTLVYDFSGNGKNGTVVGSPLFNSTGGRLTDGSYNLDGTNDMIRTLNITKVEANYTVTFWVYNSNLNANKYFYSRALGGAFYNNVAGNITIDFYNRTNGFVSTKVYPYSLPLNNWTYVTLSIYNYNNVSYGDLYINGVLISSKSANSIGLLQQMLTNFDVGHGYSGGDKYFNGSFDEFIVFNKSLTNNQIWQLYRGYINHCYNLTIESGAIGGDTTFCNSTYQLNGTTSGIFYPITDNININCNFSTFVGDKTQFLVAIYNNGESNVTIRNCIVEGYYHGFREIGGVGTILTNNTFFNNTQAISNKYGGLNNSIIYNNTFLNNTRGIYFWQSQASSIIIANNTFYLSSGSGIQDDSLPGYISNISNVTISNNVFYSYDTHNPIAQISSDSNEWIIDSNQFYGTNLLSSYGARLDGNNNIVKNNLIEGYGHSLTFRTRVINLTIQNNTIYNGDNGFQIYAGTNIIIVNNTIRNMTYDTDTYVRCGWIKNCQNVLIINNNCTEAIQGFNMQNATNVTLTQNNYDAIPFTLRQSDYKGSDRRTPACMINALELEKSWLGSGEETLPFVPYTDNITNLIGNFKSHNITIINETFDNDTLCYFSADGIDGLTHNLTNYWYVKLQLPTFLKDATEYYINNNFSELFWNGGTDTDNTAIVTTPQNFLFSTYMSSGRGTLLYKINKTRLYIQNINKDFNGIVSGSDSSYDNGATDMTINLYNLTYPNNDIIINGQCTALNVTEYNLTLSTDDYAYAGGCSLYGTSHYINTTSATCSDAYSRTETIYPTTPWCTLAYACTQDVAGDYFVVDSDAARPATELCVVADSLESDYEVIGRLGAALGTLVTVLVAALLIMLIYGWQTGNYWWDSDAIISIALGIIIFAIILAIMAGVLSGT